MAKPHQIAGLASLDPAECAPARDSWSVGRGFNSRPRLHWRPDFVQIHPPTPTAAAIFKNCRLVASRSSLVISLAFARGSAPAAPGPALSLASLARGDVVAPLLMAVKPRPGVGSANR